MGNTHKDRPVIEADPAWQMSLFDRLPLTLQDIMREAPANLDVKQIPDMHRHHSATAAERLTMALKRAYPGWEIGLS